MPRDLAWLPIEAAYFPSDFTITARLSSWCDSAVQLREMFVSTVDRRAEFLGSAPRILYSAAYALHCSTVGICASPPDSREPSALFAVPIYGALRGHCSARDWSGEATLAGTRFAGLLLAMSRVTVM
jgi:hypothetical protein